MPQELICGQTHISSHCCPFVDSSTLPPPAGAAECSPDRPVTTLTQSVEVSSSSSQDAGVHQSWALKRPVLSSCPKLTRRQLRQHNKSWTAEEVAHHKYADDAWIIVAGKVYDITEHIVSHPGWNTGCQVTTVLSILAHLGIDCTQEFVDIHAPYPVAWKQLQAFYIGELHEHHH